VKEASTLAVSRPHNHENNDDIYFEHFERQIDKNLTNSDYGTMHLNPHDRVRILGGEASGARNSIRPTSASKSGKNSTM